MAVNKIDIHTHILPRNIPKWAENFGYGGFIRLDHHADCRARMMRDDGTFFREIESNCWDPSVRVSECDALGVRVQVISTVPVMFSYWAKPHDAAQVSEYLNDHVADCVSRNPNRMIGLGTLPMQDPALAITELERCMSTLGLAGVQIGSHINQWNLGDPELADFWAAAEKLGAAVFIHPWDMMGQERMQKYWLPWLVGMPAEVSAAICSMIFSGIFDKHRRLRVAFAHGGGSFPGTLGRIEHGYHARPDLCAIDTPNSPRQQLGRFWVDSLTHDPDTLRSVIKIFGANRVALGSDYPFPLGELKPGQMIEAMSDLNPETRSALLWKNAFEWLNMDGKNYEGT